MKRGFTLIEMLMVIGIIAILIAASIGSYSALTRSAERAKATDLVQQVALALSTLYEQNDGQWPVRLAMVGEKGGELDDLAGYALATGGKTKTLTLETSGGKLIGYDRFGVLSPWGVQVMKRLGKKATVDDVRGYRLWFAVDVDGDGIISVDCDVGKFDVRAAAVVWCNDKYGKAGGKASYIRSWTAGQERHVK